MFDAREVFREVSRSLKYELLFKVVELWKQHSIVGLCTVDQTTIGLPSTELVPFDFGHLQ